MLEQKKKNEIFAFLWATAALLLFLCLFSYTPDDISIEISSPNSPAKNYVGITGAYIAWALTFVFGKGAFFFVVLLGFWSLAAWSGGRRQSLWLKFFSGTIFFVSACASLTILAGASQSLQYQRGGLIGFFVAHYLQELFGKASLYISVTLFFLSVLLATEFLVLPLIIALFTGFKQQLSKLLSSLRNLKFQKETRRGSQRSFFPTKQGNSNGRVKIQTPKSSIDVDGSTNGEKSRLQKGIIGPILRAIVPGKKEPPAPKINIRTHLPLTGLYFQDAKKRALGVKEAAQDKKATLPMPAKSVRVERGEFKLPSMSILSDPEPGHMSFDKNEIEEQSQILEETLADFGISAKVVEVEQGPVVRRFELQPASGVKIQKIVSLTDNIALAMSATSIRIIAPIPGKSRVGIEVPNSKKSLVTLKELLLSDEFRSMKEKSKLTIPIGKDTSGAPIIANLAAMPHLLIAGSTGSGKTVCVHSIISGILFNATPEEVKFILIDPKMVELASYKGIPHLLTPVLTEIDKVPTALNWLVSEMEKRYKTLSAKGVRNITGYNDKIKKEIEVYERKEKESKEEIAPPPKKMPYIVVIIDELADLMIMSGKEIEGTITRLAQLSRAVGIHLVLATQRPSVDVITGVIKANFPARISFQVASKVDSRTVLDMNGAEALLGQGDLLWLDPSQSKPIRAQGPFLSDGEIDDIVSCVTNQCDPEFNEEVLKSNPKKQVGSHDFRNDEYFEEACRIIVSSGQASVSMLQRRLGLGYTRAARLVDMMEEDGIVGPHRGSKARDILIDIAELESRQSTNAESQDESQG